MPSSMWTGSDQTWVLLSLAGAFARLPERYRLWRSNDCLGLPNLRNCRSTFHPTQPRIPPIPMPVRGRRTINTLKTGSSRPVLGCIRIPIGRCKRTSGRRARGLELAPLRCRDAMVCTAQGMTHSPMVAASWADMVRPSIAGATLAAGPQAPLAFKVRPGDHADS